MPLRSAAEGTEVTSSGVTPPPGASTLSPPEEVDHVKIVGYGASAVPDSWPVGSLAELDTITSVGLAKSMMSWMVGSSARRTGRTRVGEVERPRSIIRRRRSAW